jgi:hypothetical protein
VLLKLRRLIKNKKYIRVIIEVEIKLNRRLSFRKEAVMKKRIGLFGIVFLIMAVNCQLCMSAERSISREELLAKTLNKNQLALKPKGLGTQNSQPLHFKS